MWFFILVVYLNACYSWNELMFVWQQIFSSFVIMWHFSRIAIKWSFWQTFNCEKKNKLSAVCHIIIILGGSLKYVKCLQFRFCFVDTSTFNLFFSPVSVLSWHMNTLSLLFLCLSFFLFTWYHTFVKFYNFCLASKGKAIRPTCVCISLEVEYNYARILRWVKVIRWATGLLGC